MEFQRRYGLVRAALAGSVFNARAGGAAAVRHATLLGLGKLETQPSGPCALVILAAAFIGVHLLHLFLLDRQLRRSS